MAERIPVFLDTDIGPDCDDAGALAILLYLHKTNVCRITGITHTTGSPYGLGCIDAICLRFGLSFPLGTCADRDYLTTPECFRYTSAVVSSCENGYPPDAQQPDASDTLIRALSGESDDSVTFISIGPMRNLSRFVADARTRGIFLKKVRRIVCMAGRFDTDDTAEWNVLMDIKGARDALEGWPGEIIFCPFESYSGVLTGDCLKRHPAHPVSIAYRLHTGGGYLRPSWDPGAVIRAVKNDMPAYVDSAPGAVSIADNGVTRFTEDPKGKHRYVILRGSEREAADTIESYLEKAIELSEGVV